MKRGKGGREKAMKKGRGGKEGEERKGRGGKENFQKEWKGGERKGKERKGKKGKERKGRNGKQGKESIRKLSSKLPGSKSSHAHFFCSLPCSLLVLSCALLPLSKQLPSPESCGWDDDFLTTFLLFWFTFPRRLFLLAWI